MKKIPLTKGEFAIVDDEDYEMISQFKWCVNGSYAVRIYWDKIDKKYIHISMHRYIMKPPKDMFVDHINGDGLDNTRSNLRVCTKQQNCYNKKVNFNNKTGYRGVSVVNPTYKWTPKTNKWVAYISFKGKCRNIGYYDSPIDAARAYDEAAKKYFGDFARLNFP